MSSISLDLNAPIARLKFAGDAMGAGEISDFTSAIESLSDDDSIRAIVTTASGGWAEAVETPNEAGLLADPFGFLAEVRKPVIFVAAGEITGGSLALALAADIRIAGESASFVVDDTATGSIPIGGTTQRLARLVGRGNALDLVLSGRRIDATEAVRIGLVSEVVADPRARANEIATKIAERGPIAIGFAKEAIARGTEMPLEQALRYETDLTMILQTTEDRAEGVRAFLEKRKPKFNGR